MKNLYWTKEEYFDRTCIVVRDNGANWTSETDLIGDYRGAIVAVIPYCNEEFSLPAAAAIANEITKSVNPRTRTN